MAILEFVIILFVMTIYFLPALAAAWRRHPKTLLILALNLFLGITIVGWIVAITWAFSQNAGSHRKYDNHSSEYGGMAVSTAERFNAAVLVGVAALVAVALTAAVSVHQIRKIQDAVANQIDRGGLRPPVAASANANPYAPPDAEPHGQTAAKPLPLPSTSAAKPSLETPLSSRPIGEPPAAISPMISRTNVRTRVKAGHRYNPTKLYVDGVPLAERPPSPQVRP